jgi:hypothetical protein
LDLILSSWSKSKSTLTEDNIMEGVVIKTVEEKLRVFNGRLNRVILKYVFDQYLTKKDNTDFH